MATNFDDVFDQFLLTVDDRSLLDNLTSDVLAQTLSRYLDRARAIFGDYCYKDLTDYTSTTSVSDEFTGNGSTTIYTMSSTPPSSPEVYVSVNDVEVDEDDITYNSSSYTVTLATAPAYSADVYVAAYKTGQFTDTLNIKEIELMARAMQIPWLEFMLLKKKHLDQIVYGKNMMVHSQANQTQVNRETLETIKKDLMTDIINYTYKQNDDDLAGINGGNSLPTEVT